MLQITAFMVQSNKFTSHEKKSKNIHHWPISGLIMAFFLLTTNLNSVNACTQKNPTSTWEPGVWLKHYTHQQANKENRWLKGLAKPPKFKVIFMLSSENSSLDQLLHQPPPSPLSGGQSSSFAVFCSLSVCLPSHTFCLCQILQSLCASLLP